ncbi:hypothetical protein BJF93_19140 [Xaviernesmea oryzae]|uniref:Uncharacterized protein n=1 Tax=Xaviernesmea oryzae TaxID=464029 RepID=A0A1Q9B1C1_9HYPH|nr:hypothetical protein BJF93_19140 [Xaviernesmea oryzae]
MKAACVPRSVCADLVRRLRLPQENYHGRITRRFSCPFHKGLKKHEFFESMKIFDSKPFLKNRSTLDFGLRK